MFSDDRLPRYMLIVKIGTTYWTVGLRLSPNGAARASGIIPADQRGGFSLDLTF